jgi:hypothetical protein
MTPSFGSIDPLLITVVLASMAIGLPILMVLGIRFLWDRSLYLGRSKELEKLIWQLHRIASALEHQMSLTFPAVQPGTEEPRDLAFLQQPVVQPVATARSVSAANPAAATANQAGAQQPVNAPPAVQPSAVIPPGAPQPAAEAPRHAGVNSMFGF